MEFGRHKILERCEGCCALGIGFLLRDSPVRTSSIKSVCLMETLKRIDPFCSIRDLRKTDEHERWAFAVTDHDVKSSESSSSRSRQTLSVCRRDRRLFDRAG